MAAIFTTKNARRFCDFLGSAHIQTKSHGRATYLRSRLVWVRFLTQNSTLLTRSNHSRRARTFQETLPSAACPPDQFCTRTRPSVMCPPCGVVLQVLVSVGEENESLHNVLKLIVQNWFGASRCELICAAAKILNF